MQQIRPTDLNKRIKTKQKKNPQKVKQKKMERVSLLKGKMSLKVTGEIVLCSNVH